MKTFEKKINNKGNHEYCLDPNPMLTKLNPNHGTWERIEELVKLMKYKRNSI